MHTVEPFVDFPTRRRTFAISVGLMLFGFAAIGCGTDDAAGANTATQTPALFKDPSTSGPRLDVYGADGSAAIAVSGPIGSEAVLSHFRGGHSLVDIYRAIHPASTVPAELAVLDQQIAPQLVALRSEARPPLEAEPATIEKSHSYSSFNTTLCKTFSEGSAQYTPLRCTWANQGGDVAVGPHYDGIVPGDRTYAWNHNAYSSTLQWYKARTFTSPIAQVTVAPYTWLWMSVSSVTGTYWARLRTESDIERGLTWHSLSYIVK